MSNFKKDIGIYSDKSTDRNIIIAIIIFLISSFIFAAAAELLIKLCRSYSMDSLIWIKDVNQSAVETRKGVVYSITLSIQIIMYIFVKYKVIEKKLRINTVILISYLEIVALINLLLEFINLGSGINTVMKALTYVGAILLPFYFFYILKAIDTLSKKLAKEQLQSNIYENLSYTDKLTGIPNRAYIIYQLENKINNYNHTFEKFGILFLDLDGFKQVNDVWGHDAGDIVLKEVSKRLVNSVRLVDIVGRLGGDEFIVIISNAVDKTIFEDISKRIISDINKEIYVNNKGINVGASIGIAIYPSDGLNIDDLFKNADTALYEIKRNTKNNYKFYS